MKRTKQDYLNLLNETVSYYTTEKNELSSVDGVCNYLSPNGTMCAVGRCLINPKGKDSQLKKFKGGTGVLFLFDLYKPNKILKEQYRGFSLEFWIDLQLLHDNNDYIVNFTLTSRGRKHVEHIIGLHCKE
jgi:hypothetical protein